MRQSSVFVILEKKGGQLLGRVNEKMALTLSSSSSSSSSCVNFSDGGIHSRSTD